MIRFVIGLFIFAVALCAYIINAQHGGILPQRDAAVTAPDPIIEAPASEDDIAATEETAAQIINAIVARDLGYPTASIPVGTAVRDTLAVLGLEVPDVQASVPDKRFATLIGESLRAGVPDTKITKTVADRARAGDLAIPVGLVTADGEIDLATFLRAVVTTAVLVTEGTEPVVPDLSNDPAAIISVDGYDYVITATDSLAAIAVKFYGDVTQTSRLIQANPMALARPEQMVAGTTISVPAF
ncbi:MAG: hypothetical protein ABJO29_02630 [Yoonia sp.]|uniref:hypothetical protein n=1 Tax=Yoonia sp. TaxID=2212373 RepID=UPI003267E3C5